MAQLVKLLDYISRYENDLTRYPTQFIRLKRKQWERMKIQWETGESHSLLDNLPEEPEEILVEKKRFSLSFPFFNKNKEEVEDVKYEEEVVENEFDFNPNIIYKPQTIEELKKLYLDQLFHFQIKWASSTLFDESSVAPKYFRDSILREFVQKLPDSFLLFYEPIIKLKKAPVQMDIVLITPVECMCITILDKEDRAVYVGDGDRFWTKKVGSEDTKVLNPLLSLNRNEKILQRLFADKETSFPIKKYLISRNGYIDFPDVSYDLKVIDRRTYEEWFKDMTVQGTPLKLGQFQAAKAILDVAQSTAKSRLRDPLTDNPEQIERDVPY